MEPSVGLIGLAAMGHGMAQSLRRSGFALPVFDLRSELAQGFARDGRTACARTACASAANLARASKFARPLSSSVQRAACSRCSCRPRAPASPMTTTAR